MQRRRSHLEFRRRIVEAVQPTRLDIQAFAVRLDALPGATIVDVTGEVDLATAPRRAGALDAAAYTNVPVVLDLAHCTFMDSSGLKTLINATQLHDSVHHRPLSVCRARDGAVARMLALSGVDQVVRIFSDRVDALTSLSGGRQHESRRFRHAARNGDVGPTGDVPELGLVIALSDTPQSRDGAA